MNLIRRKLWTGYRRGGVLRTVYEGTGIVLHLGQICTFNTDLSPFYDLLKTCVGRVEIYFEVTGPCTKKD